MIDKKYKAFISYSHADIKFGRWLQKKIENYKIPNKLREKYPHLPKDLKRSIFRDEEELSSSATLPNKLIEALDASEFLIVIASPYSTTSKWVNKEIAYFKEHHGNAQVLAIIKEGEPYAKEGQLEAFPPALIANGAEPIAGDARSFGGRKRAVMKVIAGLLQVEFADLWEREKKEKRKRIFLLGVILGLFILLSSYALSQFTGNVVNEELIKIEKNIGKIEYELRHTTLSESKIIRLNNDLKRLKKEKFNKEASLESLGRLESSLGKKAGRIYREKGAKEALKVFESKINRAKREQKKEELASESVAMAKLYIEENMFEKAQSAYEEATGLLFSFGIVSEYAKFLKKQNEPKKAIVLYEKLEDEKNLLLPQKIELLRELAEVYNTNNQLKASEKTYKKVLKLYKKEPNHLKKELAVTLDSLGELYYKTNRIDKAIISHQKALTTVQSLEKKNAKKYKVELFSIFNNLGKDYREINSFKKAEAYSIEALTLVREASKKEPRQYRGELANLLLDLSFIYFENKKFSQSNEVFTESLALTRILSKENPAVYKAKLADGLRISSIRYLNSDFKKSKLLLNEALILSETLFQKNPNLNSKLFSFALKMKATHLGLEQKFKETIPIYEKALEVISVLKESDPNAYLEQSASVYLSLSMIYMPFLLKPKKAEVSTLKALEYYTLLAKKHPKKFDKYVADVYVQLADNYSSQKEWKKTEQMYLKSIDIYRYLSLKNPKQYNADLAWNLYYLANLYKELKSFKQAKKTYQEALMIQRDVVNKYAQFLDKSLLRQILWGFGRLYLEHFKNIKKAEPFMLEALKVYETLFTDKPSFVFVQSYLGDLNSLGSVYIHSKEFQKAEKILLKSLRYNEKLVKTDAKKYKKNLAKNFKSLADLYVNLKQSKKAKEYYEKALTLYETIDEPLLTLKLLINRTMADALRSLANIEEKEENFIRAEKLYLKAIKISRQNVTNTKQNFVAIGEDSLLISEHGLSFVLIDVAKLYLKKKEMKKAKKYYLEGLDILHSTLKKSILVDYVAYGYWVMTGVEKFGVSKEKLKEAKKILEAFKGEKGVNPLIMYIDDMLLNKE